MNLDSIRTAFTPHALSALRIMTGLLFLQHGTAKYLKFPRIAAMDNLQMFSPSGIAGIFELVGGALIVIGLFTRPVAFVLSGLMAVAYFMAHAPRGFFPILNQGELAILYCFVFLYLACAGGGPWSADYIVRKKS
ncbi:DoxX family protein [Vineibacter terrae]|uniref:DoxX family protein n=1 Tax=Vineibacter terrae TaxID=2586908 RepID=A0A5C8PKU8_9HYPH|nr:DoxX family protein [Vineibacter terrae]TXL74582.1 DoxX family protein [Vineibacter terrae]HEX2891585.1 DoxX family protein [Vineibacter terrae]